MAKKIYGRCNGRNYSLGSYKKSDPVTKPCGYKVEDPQHSVKVCPECGCTMAHDFAGRYFL